MTLNQSGETSLPSRQPVLAIVGPTASGKSELGIALALKHSGEIINMDSVQVYRSLYVATAKVPVNQRMGIPHHLIDIAEPTENLTAGRYGRLAAEALAEIESRGRTAILVGGTGFYLRALVQPLFESPATDTGIRDRLRAILERRGAEHLHRMLKRLDPNAAVRISPRDWSRTMRGIEFRLQTGARISEHQPNLPPPPQFATRVLVLALNPPREALYDRINRRAEKMFESGLIEEVEQLIASGVPPEAKAFQAHGYRRVVEYLLGRYTKDQALEQMKLDTRHYAKRQWSWWRTWPGVKWIDRFGDDPESLADAEKHIEDWRTTRE